MRQSQSLIKNTGSIAITNMDPNPYEPPPPETGSEPIMPPPQSADADSIDQPTLAYTADGNIEANSVVTWLASHGVRSYAVEDHSGVSLFAFGTISQFHKPQVFVSKSDLQRAGELLRQFEDRRAERRTGIGGADKPPIVSECEDCGASSEFPALQDGTTQNCPKCGVYMDVGSFDWPDDFDFGASDAEPQPPDNPDDAIQAASTLERMGDWDDAIAAYQKVADQWPEHATYVGNCIADVQRKIDASR